jgi:hypothetical protein
MKAIQKIGVSIKRLPQIILQPAKFYSQNQGIWLDGILVVILLFIATVLQKLAWLEIPGEPLSQGAAAQLSAMNTIMAWTGFFGIYYLFMLVFKRRVDPADLLGAAGTAALPLVLTTLISVVSWWVGNAVGISSIMNFWLLAQNVLGWLGLALSWPGWMGYYVLRYKLLLPGKWPVILPIILLVIFFAGWLTTSF